jgi:hypothetical protein
VGLKFAGILTSTIFVSSGVLSLFEVDVELGFDLVGNVIVGDVDEAAFDSDDTISDILDTLENSELCPLSDPVLLQAVRSMETLIKIQIEIISEQ